VTICTHNRACLFGEIVNGEMRLNEAGNIAQQCWDDIPVHFPDVDLDEFVVMPNHIHGIVVITGVVGANNYSPIPPPPPPSPPSQCVGANNYSPLPPIPPLPPPRPCGTSKTIGSIVRGYKIGVTKWMRNNTPIYDVWQRNYWEHIVRNEPELNRIREYIRNNPSRWELDKLHSSAQYGRPAGGPNGISEPITEYGTEAWMV